MAEASTGAHTEDRMSAGSGRIELITRGERRRAWTVDQKREITMESLAPGTVTAEVARRHGIGTGLLYTWRKQFLGGELGEVTRVVPSFLRVDVAELPARVQEDAAATVEADLPPLAALTATPMARAAGLIEIVLPGGVLLRVDAHVDGRALRRVLGALEGR